MLRPMTYKPDRPFNLVEFKDLEWRFIIRDSVSFRRLRNVSAHHGYKSDWWPEAIGGKYKYEPWMVVGSRIEGRRRKNVIESGV